MSRAIACFALAVLATAGIQAAVVRQPQPPGFSSALVFPGGPPLQAHNTLIRESLARIEGRSPLWREAIGELRRSRRSAHVLTPDQVVVDSASGREPAGAFDTVLAEAAPVLHADSQVDVVLVVVNVDLIEQLHRRTGSLPAELHADLDRIIVHEVYGHAMPYLLAGDLSGRCADPLPGQPAHDACAIRRENAVRAELGLGRRMDYGLSDLYLARRSRP
jgi:hypothetical protein